MSYYVVQDNKRGLIQFLTQAETHTEALMNFIYDKSVNVYNENLKNIMDNYHFTKLTYDQYKKIESMLPDNEPKAIDYLESIK